MKKIFFEPITHSNQFIEINKNILEKIGYKPVKFSLKSIISNLKNRTPLVLNWVEDQPYRKDIGKLKAFLITVKFLVLIGLSPIFSSKRVWIKHNFKPHNSVGSLFYYNIICFFLKFFQFEKVYLESYLGGSSIIHPLYLADEKLSSKVSVVQNTSKNKAKKVLFFGAVKKYKGLHTLLEEWPPEIELIIRGKCVDLSYASELMEIIIRRKLNATWVNGFVSDSELENLLECTDFIILPHEDESMISSGTFYHAISYGCNVLTKQSRFALAKSERHNFVNVVDFAELNPLYLQEIYIDRSRVIESSLANYSRANLQSCWAKILD
ncbi:hypothetical protein J8L84_02690 [Alteromonas sp. MMG017]|uniref:hypothetical protein n=1 Tax=Alteromonas sp. MMG017 TaxID=2822692 RepID=UPI001B3A74FC|nr:hypothetical protein [Alteromonas sp. MMG017]MBQ4828186.1 hypothetical protein [Alteromonas sp. MMG017]